MLCIVVLSVYKNICGMYGSWQAMKCEEDQPWRKWKSCRSRCLQREAYCLLFIEQVYRCYHKNLFVCLCVCVPYFLLSPSFPSVLNSYRFRAFRVQIKLEHFAINGNKKKLAKKKIKANILIRRAEKARVIKLSYVRQREHLEAL